MTAWTEITPFESESEPHFISPELFNSMATNIMNLHERTTALEGITAGGGIPLSGMILWYGIESQLPEGWQICNGLNNTLNLINRFLMGASTDDELGSTGGSVSHTHGNPNTNSAGSHGHTIDEVVTSFAGTGTASSGTGNTIPQPTHYHFFTPNIGTAGDHTHGIGGTGSSSSLPPYKKFYWITRIT